MTAKYIAETNELQELSQIKQPIKRVGQFKVGTREYYQNVREWAKYNSHTSSLRLIPCDPFCREVFKAQCDYEEGKDYEVKGAGDWKWCYQLKGNIFASPITVKTEDELWSLFIEQIKDAIFANDTPAKIAELKKHYTLIKK